MRGIDEQNLRYGSFGSVAQATLSIRAYAQTLAAGGEVGHVAGLMAGVAGDAIQNLRNRHGATPEQLVDLAIGTLDSFRPDSLVVPAEDEMLRFFAGLRATLEPMRGQLVDTGSYYASRAAIGQYIGSGQSAPPTLRRAVLYFDEILREYYQIIEAGGESFKLQSMDLRSILVAANNGGNYLDDLSGPNEKVKVGWVWSQTAAVFALINCRQLEFSDNEGEGCRKALLAFMGDELKAEELPNLTLAAIDAMMFGSSAWQGRLGNRYAMLVASLAGAIVRCSISSRGEDGGSAFFNAGVELLRLRTANEKLRSHRAIVNGLGLAWATTTSEEVLDVLTASHGMSCAVNFFAAMTDFTDLSPEEHSSLIALAQVLSAAKPDGHLLSEAYERLMGSLRELEIQNDITKPLEQPVTVRTLQETIDRCLSLILLRFDSGASWPVEAGFVNLEQRVTQSARWLGVVARDVANKLPDSKDIPVNFRDAAQHFLSTAAEVSCGQEKSLEAAVKTSLAKLYGPDPNAPGEEISILVKSGILTDDQYRAELKSSQEGIATPIEENVRQCRYSWIIGTKVLDNNDDVEDETLGDDTQSTHSVAAVDPTDVLDAADASTTIRILRKSLSNETDSGTPLADYLLTLLEQIDATDRDDRIRLSVIEDVAFKLR